MDDAQKDTAYDSASDSDSNTAGSLSPVNEHFLTAYNDETTALTSASPSSANDTSTTTNITSSATTTSASTAASTTETRASNLKRKQLFPNLNTSHYTTPTDTVGADDSQDSEPDLLQLFYAATRNLRPPYDELLKRGAQNRYRFGARAARSVSAESAEELVDLHGAQDCGVREEEHAAGGGAVRVLRRSQRQRARRRRGSDADEEEAEAERVSEQTSGRGRRRTRAGCDGEARDGRNGEREVVEGKTDERVESSPGAWHEPGPENLTMLMQLRRRWGLDVSTTQRPGEAATLPRDGSD